MQIAITYYLVDIVAEKIVATFNAISDEVARRIMSKIVSENKFDGYSDSINVYKDSHSTIRILETSEEVFENCDLFDFLIQPFEGVSDCMESVDANSKSNCK